MDEKTEDEPISPLSFEAKAENVLEVLHDYTGKLRKQKMLDGNLKREKVAELQQVQKSAHLEALRKNSQSTHIVNSMPSRVIMNLSSSVFQSVLSIFACIVYVISTYYNDQTSGGLFQILEIIIASLFSVDYVGSFWKSKDKKKFMLNVLNLIDLLTILPVIVSLLSSSPGSTSLAFARIFRILRIVRVIRLYKIYKRAGQTTKNGRPLFESSEVNRQIVVTISTLLAMVFISTGIIHALYQAGYFTVLLPSAAHTLTFDLAFYYIIITTFTIGYGDTYPLNTFSRAIIGIFIVCVIVIMSQQTARLSELVRKSSQYKRPYNGVKDSHVVLTGSLTGIAILRFLREFYHPDHEMKRAKCSVLLVSGDPPTREILEILNHPNFEENVQYLEADYLREDTLSKALVDYSRGVFILTNQHSQDSVKNDTYAVLAASATKTYCYSIPVFVQLVKPEMLVHQDWVRWDSAFSTWRIKIGLLAANVFTPGFSTFICNLLTSRSQVTDRNLMDTHWLLEYLHGLENEFYLVPLPARYIGQNFHIAVSEMYAMKQAIVIGVQSKQKDDLFDIYLNPVNYCFKEDDKVFVIAVDSKSAQFSSEVLEPVQDPVTEDIAKELERLKTRAVKRKSLLALEEHYYAMWEQDLRGLIWDHILVFGRVEHLTLIMETFNHLTSQTICFVSNLPPDKTWQQVSRRFKNVIYLQCSLSEPEELSHTAINFSCHVLIFSSKVNDMSLEDSGVLPLVRLIEHTFTCNYTVELVNEINMKYLEQKPLLELVTLKHIMWPRYAASNVFLSSTLDFFLAQGFYNTFVLELVQRLIWYENNMVETGVDENCRIQSLPVPSTLAGKATFQQVFRYYLNRPRPILVLAVYRAVGPLGNDSPYILTSPDPQTVLFHGDSLVILGNTDDSAQPEPALKRHDTVRFKGRTRAKAATTILVRKETIADSAVRVVEDEKDVLQSQSDEDLVKALEEHLKRTKREREVLDRQDEMLMNLVSEYTTIKQLLLGNNEEDPRMEESEEEKTPPISPY